MEIGSWGSEKADLVPGRTGGGAGGSGLSWPGPRGAGRICADGDGGEAEVNIVGEGIATIPSGINPSQTQSVLAVLLIACYFCKFFV